MEIRTSPSAVCEKAQGAKGKSASGSNREAESTDAPDRGDCSVVVMKRVMPVERRGQVIAHRIGSTGHGRSPLIHRRRQPSRGGTSRINREVHVRICERLGGNSLHRLASGR